MRIQLTENHTHGIHEWKSGDVKTLCKCVGQKLIDEGKAILIDADDNCGCGK